MFVTQRGVFVLWNLVCGAIDDWRSAFGAVDSAGLYLLIGHISDNVIVAWRNWPQDVIWCGRISKMRPLIMMASTFLFLIVSISFGHFFFRLDCTANFWGDYFLICYRCWRISHAKIFGFGHLNMQKFGRRRRRVIWMNKLTSFRIMKKAINSES